MDSGSQNKRQRPWNESIARPAQSSRPVRAMRHQTAGAPRRRRTPITADQDRQPQAVARKAPRATRAGTSHKGAAPAATGRLQECSRRPGPDHRYAANRPGPASARQKTDHRPARPGSAGCAGSHRRMRSRHCRTESEVTRHARPHGSAWRADLWCRAAISRRHRQPEKPVAEHPSGSRSAPSFGRATMAPCRKSWHATGDPSDQKHPKVPPDMQQISAVEYPVAGNALETSATQRPASTSPSSHL